ncbi:MAG: hypothetical protein HRU19_16495 [Pseudobacteriovorax sp.]|nr:hypothetical protein [Pseudobacteriovorax sp.]
MKKTFTLSIFILLLFTAPKRSFSSELNIGLTKLPNSIDPIGFRIYDHFLAVRPMYQTLVRIDENLIIRPFASSKWKVSENGKKYVFQILRDQRFSNGELVTARDVALSISRHFWNDGESIFYKLLKDVFGVNGKINPGRIIDSINIIDEYSLSITLQYPYKPFLQVLSVPAFSIVHLDKKFDVTSGSGPYILKKATPKKWMFQKRSELKRPIESINIYGVDNKSDFQYLLKNKTLDLVISPKIAQVGSIPPEYTIAYKDSLAVSHFFYNTSAKFSEKKARIRFNSLSRRFFLSTNEKTLSPIDTYIPAGLLSKHYYDRKIEESQVTNVVEKDLVVRILVKPSLFSKSFLMNYAKFMEKYGYQIDFIDFKNDGDPNMLKGDYDLVNMGYLSLIPDAEGLLTPIIDNTHSKYGVFNRSEIIAYVSETRKIESYSKRVLELANFLKMWEEDNKFILPGFQINLPMLYKPNLVVPASSYRYELDFLEVKFK